MRSVIICLLSLLFVSALGVAAGNQGLPSLSSHPPSALNPPSTQLPSVNQPARLAPINPPSTRPTSTRLPSVLQHPIFQPSIHQPSIHQHPTNPQHPQTIRPRPIPHSAHLPPPHGQIVAFQANTGRHAGIILGSHPDQQKRFKVAPVKLSGKNPAQGPVFVSPYNEVVRVHHDNLVSTDMSAPSAASHLMGHHAQYPPVENHVTAPIYGSCNYFALHGSGKPGGRRRR